MGLLDEAIREHLELKRLRGADPSEIARAERDALGPVRRAADPAEESAAEADRELAPQPGDHPGDDPGHLAAELHEDPVDPDSRAAPVPPLPTHDVVAGAPPSSASGGRLEEADEWLAYEPSEAAGSSVDDDEFPPVDEHATQVYRAPTDLPDPPAAPPPASVPMVEDLDRKTDAPAGGAGREAGRAEERSPVAPAPSGVDEPHEDQPVTPEGNEGEDVLEETPDFLQETPEHDRLWFEQRPPRDFDFDK